MTDCNDGIIATVDNSCDRNQNSVPVIITDNQAEGEMTTSADANTDSASDVSSSKHQLGMPRISTNNPVPSSTPPTPSEELPRRYLRPRNNIVSYKGMNIELDDGDNGPSFDILPPQCFSAVVSDDTPRSYKKAMKSPNADMWKAACEKEIAAMIEKKVWTLVKRPKGVNVIRGLWLFKKKHTVDGLISKFKARFVAMGNTQREGSDY